MKWFKKLSVTGKILWSTMMLSMAFGIMGIMFLFTPQARAQEVRRVEVDHKLKLKRSATFVSRNVLYVSCAEVTCAEAKQYFIDNFVRPASKNFWKFDGTHVDPTGGTLGFYYVRWPN